MCGVNLFGYLGFLAGVQSSMSCDGVGRRGVLGGGGGVLYSSAVCRSGVSCDSGRGGSSSSGASSSSRSAKDCTSSLSGGCCCPVCETETCPLGSPGGGGDTPTYIPQNDPP